MSRNPMEPMVTLNEAARRWGVKHTEVRYELNRSSGTYQGMPIVQIGGRFYFRASDVDRYEERLASR